MILNTLLCLLFTPRCYKTSRSKVKLSKCEELRSDHDVICIHRNLRRLLPFYSTLEFLSSRLPLSHHSFSASSSRMEAGETQFNKPSSLAKVQGEMWAIKLPRKVSFRYVNRKKKKNKKHVKLCSKFLFETQSRKQALSNYRSRMVIKPEVAWGQAS